MRKVAHYFYGCGNEIVISVKGRMCCVLDERGNHPFDPIYKKPNPYPGDGEEQLPSFEEIGLYYGYDMPDTGWSGDC